MKFREGFDSIVQKVNKVNEVMMIVTILIMFVVLLAQIGSRFIFFVPLPQSQDIILFFLIACVFFGVGTAVSQDKMITIDLITHYLPEKKKALLLLVADVVSAAFLLVLIRQGVEMVEHTRGTIIGASPFTVDWYYWLIVIGSVVMFLNYLNNMFKRIAILRSGGSDK